jgi:nitrilase
MLTARERVRQRCSCVQRGAELVGQAAAEGAALVVTPGGKVIAGPLHEQQDILYAEIDLSRVAISRRSFDAAGDYSRPDIFTLHIDTKTQTPVAFD